MGPMHNGAQLTHVLILGGCPPWLRVGDATSEAQMVTQSRRDPARRSHSKATLRERQGAVSRPART